MLRDLRLLFISVPFVMGACGGEAASSAPPQSPASPSAGGTEAVASQSAALAAPAASPTPAPASAAPAPVEMSAAEYQDPHESAGFIAMAPLIGKSTPKDKFPKATTTDRACWESIMLSGDHQKDFAEIIAKCGAPTGLLEYAHPVTGKLHHKHDKRDSYILKLSGGMCYRYFGVADTGISDLDILIERKGALVADDKTSQPVAIIESDKPWCMTHDEEYEFQIEVEGPGNGGYTFGVWARPNK